MNIEKDGVVCLTFFSCWFLLYCNAQLTGRHSGINKNNRYAQRHLILMDNLEPVLNGNQFSITMAAKNMKNA